MPRTRNAPATNRRRKRVLRRARGYWGNKSRLFRFAKDAVDRSGQYAYRDRRNRKRAFRSLWIQRINAGARSNGMSYSKLIHGLKLGRVEVNRKMLADVAVQDPEGFAQIATRAKEELEAKAA